MVKMVTVKREAELLFLNSSSSFNPPRCREKSNGLPAMYLRGVSLLLFENFSTTMEEGSYQVK